MVQRLTHSMQSFHEQQPARTQTRHHLDNREQYPVLAEHAVEAMCKLEARGIDAALQPYLMLNT